ncbi:MAG TPA: MFS transporter [Bacteroidia bacterium]|jgi:MFS family permease|nr:MFS transporter [Bacteroidia bacterium]
MSAPVSALSIFKSPGFRNFILGRLFTTLAIQMQMTTIGLEIYYEYLQSYTAEQSAYVLGQLGLYEAIPFIITSFLSGYIADRFNRKRIIMISCTAIMLSSVVLYFISTHHILFFEKMGYHIFFFVIIIIGIIRSFNAASMMPFMSELVDRNFYTSSATWNSTVWHVSSISGPVLGAVLYGFMKSAEVIYLINAGLFLTGMFSFSVIKYKPLQVKQVKEGIIKSLREGIDFVFQKKLLLSAISLDLFAVLFGGAVAILPAFNDKILHASPEQFGLLRTAPAVGALLMAVVITLKPPGKRAGISLLMAVIGFGVFTILFALCTNYWLAFAALLMTGALDNISVVVRQSVMQLVTPDHMRGRVSAVNSVFIGSSNEIGGYESGLAARIMGLVPSIIFGGGMTILVVLGINKLNPELKKLDLKKV